MFLLKKLLKGLTVRLKAKLPSYSPLISKASVFPEGRQYYAFHIIEYFMGLEKRCIFGKIFR